MKQALRNYAWALALPFLLVNTNLYCQVAEPSSELQEVKDELAELRGEFDALIKTLKERRVLPQPAFSASDAEVNISQASVKGSDNAKYAVVEMSDFQCPYCARYSTQTYPRLMQDYVDTGKIKYAFMDFPLISLHKQARKAAEIARCAGDQGKFWEMHDQLFARFQEIEKQDWTNFGTVIGLDSDEFSACVDSSKYAEAVTQDMTVANKLGVRGTPTFVLGELAEDGVTVKGWKMGSGAQPFQIFQQELEAMLSGAASE